MFDTHCHLNLSEFDDKLENTINSARGVGIEMMLIPGTDFKNSRKAVDISRDFEGLFAAVGIHPTTVIDQDFDKILLRIEELTEEPMLVRAIGEIGLDYYHLSRSLEVPGRDEQIDRFTKQLKLAVKLNLPVIIHNRQSSDDVMECLENVGIKNFQGKAVFHCCPPEDEVLEFAKENQIFIGVDGDVTYDKDKAKFVGKVPLELLVLETDSPYLMPEPIRSEKRFPNTPVNLEHISRKVSDIKNESIDSIKKITTNNACRLFGV